MIESNFEISSINIMEAITTFISSILASLISTPMESGNFHLILRNLAGTLEVLFAKAM